MGKINVLLLGCLAVVCADKFPGTIKRCHLKDNTLDECLKEGIQDAYELLGKGAINTLSLVGIDPLIVNTIVIGAGTKAVHLTQNYADVKIYGFSKSKITKAHLDMDKKVLTYETSIPELQQKAKYDINGKVMVIPVYGKGDSIITLRDVTIKHTIQFKEESKNGKKHFVVDSYNIEMGINGAHYDFQNLFDGDKMLAENILNVVNDNWKEVFDDVKEGLQNAFAEVCKQVANGLFSHVPVNEIFLE